MTKQNKIWVGLGAVALYLLWKNKANKTSPSVVGAETVVSDTLSDDEKNSLFNATLGYRGGARPSQQTINTYNMKSKTALARVELLGLSAELKAWNESRKDLPLPQSANPQGGGGLKLETDFPMTTFQF